MSTSESNNNANTTAASAKALESFPPPSGIVYGPIESRRLGRSLGVNLTGDAGKACSFDCGYCDLGRTELPLNRLKKDFVFPAPDEIRATIETALRTMRDHSEKLDWICLSGNGEPTLHPDFDHVVLSVLEARAKLWPEIKVSILTNGAHADSRRVRAGLDRLDARMIKIDAGNERTFKAINGPLTRVTLAKILANARLLKDVTVQALFVDGPISNMASADIEDWIEAVALVKPKAVHITGLSRVPAYPGFTRADEDSLYVIASKLERRTQIKALVFP